MVLNTSFKTSWMILCFGAAAVLFLAAIQPSKSISPTVEINEAENKPLVIPFKKTESHPSQKPSPHTKPVPASLKWGLGLESPNPLTSWMIHDQSEFRQTQLQPALPITPQLTMLISAVSSRLVVDLSEAKVYSYWADQEIASYPVAVGQPGWETPTGTFKILRKQRNPVWRQPITGELIPAGPDSPLGDRWIGFWADEHHQIGFHGTNKENLVGQAISHGCLRMRNADIRALYDQVTIGTQVIVRN